MKHPFPYPPLSKETQEAIARIESASSWRGLEDAHAIVEHAAMRRTLAGLQIALPIIALSVVVAVVGRQLGWLDPPLYVAVALVPAWLFTSVVEFVLRGPRPIEDERRLRDALNVWNVLRRAEKRA